MPRVLNHRLQRSHYPHPNQNFRVLQTVVQHGVSDAFFTDGDLRRLLDVDNFDVNRPVRDVMHTNPKQVAPERLVEEAARLMRENKVDQVPVIDAHGRPVGLLDVQDLLAARPV